MDKESSHKYQIGQLVQMNTKDFQNNDDLEYLHGSRLFVIRHTKDCDGTPLYVLSANKNDLKMESHNHLCTKMHGGYNEGCLLEINDVKE